MKTFLKCFRYIIIVPPLLIAFQNCGSEHMSSRSTSSDSLTGELDPAAVLALQNQALSVLSFRCGSCHNGGVSGVVPDVSNVTELRLARYIIPGQPQNSPLLLTIYDGTMPKGGPNMVNNFPAEVNVIRDWIQAIR